MKKCILILLFLLSTIFVNAQFGPNRIIGDYSPEVFDLKDIDGDGDVDLLSGGSCNRLFWYENLGAGLMMEPIVIGEECTVGMNSISSVLGEDIDGDGDVDIIFSGYNIDKIGWYENLGGGIFGPQQLISSSVDEGRSVFLADLDGDGDLDVLSASYDDDKIAWYENLGSGIIDTTQIIISLMADGATTVFAADMDGDLDIDVLSASDKDHKIAWYKNLGGGVIDTTQQIISINATNTLSLSASDLDGDLDIDIVSALSGDDKIVWFENLGGGIIDTTQNILDSLWLPKHVSCSDVDNDGDMDIFASSYNGYKFVWFKNLGGGSFSPSINISTSSRNAWFHHTGDVDSDGDLDFVGVSSEGVNWFENLGGGIIDTTQKLLGVGIYNMGKIDVSDLTGNGYPDLLFGGGYGVFWRENLGLTKMGPIRRITTDFTHCRRVLASDMDGDGDGDVIVASDQAAFGRVVWHENLGAGNIDTNYQLISQNVDRPRSVIVADMDGDLDKDVVVGSINDNKIVWFENLGSGNYDTTQQVVSLLTNNVNDIHSNDLDNDGDIDIVYASYSDHKIAWFPNNGNGTFGLEQLINERPGLSASGGGSKAVHSVDLDNDGDFDVVSTNFNEVTITWYLNMGGGNFDTTQRLIPVPDGPPADPPVSIDAADINGDGNVDLVLGRFSPYATWWYENLGNGFFLPRKLSSNDVGVAYDVLPIDFDLDGDMDVVSSKGVGNDFIRINENYDYYPKLSGKVFYDANQNTLLDTNELGLTFIPVQLQPNSVFNFSDTSGRYVFGVDTGIYIVNYSLDTMWNLTTDSSSYTKSLTFLNFSADSLNFGFYPDTIITIINPDLTGDLPRCNQIITYWLDIANKGTTIPSGVIHLQLDNDVVFVTSDVVPDSINGQNFYWHYDTLFFYTHEQINLQVQMPPFTSMGDTLTSILTVHELDGLGNIIYSNADTLEQLLVCAYDPNDKSVIPVGFGSQGYISNNQEMEYLIRFQNTGNDTAITIMVRDTLDANLNWNTLQPIASSHAMQVWTELNGEVVFKFENIMLPDSNVNEIESHGFVKFKIEQNPNLLPNTPINNTAQIYFDFNPAVVTNTVLNTIEDCSGSGMDVSMVVNKLDFCKNDTLIVYHGDTSSVNNHSWNLGGFYFSSDSLVNLVLDTTGVFNLVFTSNYVNCIKDSVVSITVNPMDVTIGTFASDTICENNGVINLPPGLPTGGVFSGNGVGGGIFDPVIAGIGVHDVIYIYTDTNSCVNSDTTIVTVELCVGIDEVANDFGIFIYPNPNTGQFTIEKPIGLNKEVKVKLLDATSKLILDKVIPIDQQKVEMDITNYSKGIYYLQLIVGEEVFVKQILKN